MRFVADLEMIRRGKVGCGGVQRRSSRHQMLMDDVTSPTRNAQQPVTLPQQQIESQEQRVMNMDVQVEQEIAPCPPILTPMSDNPSSAASCNESEKRPVRGKYKCLKVDMKTKNGKLEVDIPDDILRVVGNNARDIVNFCGYVVRSYAPLFISKKDVPVNASWVDVVEVAGERMCLLVKEKFSVPPLQENRFHGFVLSTMQRLYRGWKNRLHVVYKKFKTNEDRLSNIPEDVKEEDWKLLIDYFGSNKFQKVSQRNTTNRAKLVTKHTCGTKSFAEVEESTRDPITGEKAPPDEVWLLQHTKKNKEGEIQWSDPKSKEIHEQLEDLVNQQQSQENGPQLTRDEILLQVLGEKPGYVRGKGAGKATSSKRCRQQENVQEQVQKALALAKETMREELRAEVREDVIESLRRDEMRTNANTQSREEIQAQIQNAVDAMFQSRMAAFFSTMSQQRPSTSSLNSDQG